MIFASNVAGDPQNWLPTAIGLVVAILGGGGVAALIRAKPEGSKILIDAAAGVVVVQTGVISDLRKQLEEARAEIDELRQHVDAMSPLRIENDRLKIRVEHLEFENTQLRKRVAELEQHKTQTS
jgi:hypothetical protein